MKKFVLFSFILCSFSLADAAKKHTRKKKQVKKTVVQQTVTPVLRTTTFANTMRLCDAPSPQPTWFLANPVGFSFPANFQAPAAYRLVTTIDTVMHSFLSGIPYKDSKVKMVLPLFMDNTVQCKEFIVTRTETMDSVLQAKYPELMSFKARTEANGLNTARIDCDETSMKIMITYDNKTYFVTSVLYKNAIYYACYSKDDVNFQKQKFER